jgi:NADP-dependent aldehyde dehydrogenase
MRAIDPSNGSNLDPLFSGGTTTDVEQACGLAWLAFDIFRETGLEVRARLLEGVAEQLLALGDSLIERACAETGLPKGRIEGERGRTVNQLRLFADVVRDGGGSEAQIDPAQPSHAVALVQICASGILVSAGRRAPSETTFRSPFR